jgi:hypothetical protein
VKKHKQGGYVEEVLRHTKYCFLKNPEKLTEKQQAKLDDVLEYDLKSVRAMPSRLGPIKGFVKTIRVGTSR